MKKGLTLVAAMIGVALICLVGTAAAMTGVSPHAMTAAATAVAVAVVFGSIIAIAALALYRAMSAKKGHTFTRPRHSAKTINAEVLAVLGLVNAVYTHTTRGKIAISPKVLLHKR